MKLNHFNSHAHVERDIFYGTQTKQNFISTHTLTWSVTITMKNEYYSLKISTHTLTWSVTLAMFSVVDLFVISTHTLTWSVTLLPLPQCLSFQISTHTLTWSVTHIVTPCHFLKTISTHTLTWSVTVAGKEVEYLVGNFNSHAHVERDKIRKQNIRIIRRFQLTRSRGA